MEYLDLINLDHIVEWRNYLHQHPELSFEEVETSKYIYEVLSGFNDDDLVLSNPTKTSVMAVLDTKKPGKTIALRADIDALPIQEEADVLYKSKVDGKMHACGHDTHTAMLLGAIEALLKIKESLTGKVKFIFQHAEELLPGGARELVEVGIMNDVDQVYGIHIVGGLPVGFVGSRLDVLTASADTFELSLQGLGSHGSTPEKAIDLVVVGSQIVNALQTIVSRTIASVNQCVVTVGQFNIGTAPNIIADNGFISGTIRAVNKDVRKKIEERLYTIVNNIADTYDAKVDINFIHGYSSVVNSSEPYNTAINAINKIKETEYVVLENPQMGAEDFSAYTDVVPGCFLMVGGGDDENYKYYNHHPKFRISQPGMLIGSKIHMQIVLDILMK